MRAEIEDDQVYDGKAGVALFLYELYGATGGERWREAADELLDDAVDTRGERPGLYVGGAGVGQVALEAWRITEHDRYLDLASETAGLLPRPRAPT